MKTCDDIDKIAVQAVVDSIRNTAEEGSSETYRDLWECLREIRNEVHDLFERLDKVFAEARTLRIVPFSGQHNV